MSRTFQKYIHKIHAYIFWAKIEAKYLSEWNLPFTGRGEHPLKIGNRQSPPPLRGSQRRSLREFYSLTALCAAEPIGFAAAPSSQRDTKCGLTAQEVFHEFMAGVDSQAAQGGRSNATPGTPPPTPRLTVRQETAFHGITLPWRIVRRRRASSRGSRTRRYSRGVGSGISGSTRAPTRPARGWVSTLR